MQRQMIADRERKARHAGGFRLPRRIVQLQPKHFGPTIHEAGATSATLVTGVGLTVKFYRGRALSERRTSI